MTILVYFITLLTGVRIIKYGQLRTYPVSARTLTNSNFL